MKIFILFLAGIFLTNILWAQRSCDDVRTGMFYAKSSSKSDQVFVTVERSASEQIEILSEGDTIHYTLKWLSDCKYVLENNEFDERIRMVVTITKVRAKYYDYTTTMLGQPPVTGRMYRKNKL